MGGDGAVDFEGAVGDNVDVVGRPGVEAQGVGVSSLVYSAGSIQPE